MTSSGGATDRQKPQAGRRSALGWVMALVGVVLLAAIAAAALASHGAGSGGATPAGARATISASATVVPAASPSPPPPTAKPAQGGGVVQVGKTDPTPALPVATVPHGTAPDSATAVPPTAVLPAPSEPTLIPTFTPPPTQAPATVPPRPIIAATRPPAPTPQSSAGSTGGVTLLRPSPGERITGPAEFAWQPDAGYALKAGEQYELIVWGVDEDPMRDGRSPVGSKTDTAVRADLAGVEGALGLSSGRSYLWGVRLITASGTRIRMLAEGRQFVYERPADGGEPPPVPTIPQCTGPGCK